VVDLSSMVVVSLWWWRWRLGDCTRALHI